MRGLILALAGLAAALVGGRASAQSIPSWSIYPDEGACIGVYTVRPTKADPQARMYGFEWQPGVYLSFFAMDQAKTTRKEGDATPMIVGSEMGPKIFGEARLQHRDGRRSYVHTIEDRKDTLDLLAGDLTIALRDPERGDIVEVLPLGQQVPRIRKCMAEAQAQTKALAAAGGARSQPAAAAAAPATPAGEGPTLSGSGSGVFVNAKGQLLTNAHVVDACRVIGNAVIGQGKVIAVDAASDLALVQFARTPRGHVALRAETLKLGEGVVAAGYPLSGLLDNGLNVTSGNVSALSGLRGDRRFVQVTTPVQPGNSGGPLLDGSGRLVGLVFGGLKDDAESGLRPQNVNYAVAPFVIQAFLQEHDVAFTHGRSARETAESIAAKARGHTVQLECWT
jgi:S1-C subfamily serine protease